MSFDPSRAWLNDPDYFQRFDATTTPEALATAGLSADTELLVIEREGAAVAYIMHQMSYHHCAQGELKKQPYVVSF